jgi:sialic acid synthase SpsE
MKRKIVYVSSDGKTLESREKALKYLDDVYGNAMTGLAHKIASTTPKYYSLVEYLTSDSAKLFMKKGLDALKEKEEFLRYEKDLENDLSND